MTPIETAATFVAFLSIGVAVWSLLNQRRLINAAVLLADHKAYWKHQAATLQAAASIRGRHARACRTEHDRAKVMTRTAELRKELAL